MNLSRCGSPAPTSTLPSKSTNWMSVSYNSSKPSPGRLIQNPRCRSSRRDTCSQNEVGMPVGGEHSAGFDDTSLVFAVIELRHGAR